MATVLWGVADLVAGIAIIGPLRANMNKALLKGDSDLIPEKLGVKPGDEYYVGDCASICCGFVDYDGSVYEFHASNRQDEEKREKLSDAIRGWPNDDLNQVVASLKGE